MKQLISATLSKEAAVIYNSWPKQKKSAKISDIICEGDSYLKRVFFSQKFSEFEKIVFFSSENLEKFASFWPLF